MALLKVLVRANELGWVASRPTRDCRYDLILDDGKQLHRVQVKYCNRRASHASGAVMQDMTKGGQRTRVYLDGEIDAVLIYVAPVGKIVWLGPDVFHGRRQIQLRYEPARSGQVRGTLLVQDFEW